MLTAIVAAFAGGIILNFMPCVFPVVSLKALGLLRHQHSPARTRLEGLAFMLGVVATMLILVAALLLARAGGSAVGWGFQLQSPQVIALLALIMLACALNLFGLFEMGLTIQRASGVAGDRGGLTGATLTGALAIVVATPCTAPVMASAVGYALTQPPAVTLVIFTALAIGFAAPFTLISCFPLVARWLPHPGAWMATLKKALAFPILGAAAWLVWVLERQAGSAALATILACALLLSLAAWLYGIAQQRYMQGKPALPAYVTSGLFILLLAPALIALNSSPQADDGMTASVADNAAASVVWSPQNVDAVKGQGKPVFVNFTAAWCITCQVNDRTSLTTRAVKQAMAKTGTIYMIADSTKFNPDIEQALSDFGRGGLPLYVVYPANGGKPLVLPQVLTPDTVISALDKASAAGKKA
ncbi:cytochrome C biogenesis protein [Erwinia sp. OLTSP20]|uniref:protein-disulfide reductase DsbD family protein n=1 Tax=unclassified Erwinia TaxID=2622719 RepID=UPI000C1940B6|nr:MULTISPECIES: thioredoxin family protein [unclassified Erwinia]PIJ50335.1 cytochrome C biogenesis protein [Erwinia sp. OAMSP11]PIJ72172.1 cytochrome C biogenesis protein [Erwinia sp. OLSSP12]PIJ81463.1 cytochrome C biogenesis protein [Erwinia sp. OLCASP19]PIJ84169.1 cytochrome C biogenesis protein [Erwinia sp. OLMTSP26]PIJ85868.1 cytochrome C biogenesis protein [Erwinia sp. OLMDSP33]